jgi:hypothetical protein
MLAAGSSCLVLVVFSACGSTATKAQSGVTVSTGASTSVASSVGSKAKPGSGKCSDDVRSAYRQLLVNWQLVIGLSREPKATKWAERLKPIGTVDMFASQIATLKTAIGTDADAAKSLDFMAGANDIVQRGIGGDSAAAADLAKYLGTDVAALIKKQVPIADAANALGC